MHPSASFGYRSPSTLPAQAALEEHKDTLRFAPGAGKQAREREADEAG
jgi:hypothetical protein